MNVWLVSALVFLAGLALGTLFMRLRAARDLAESRARLEAANHRLGEFQSDRVESERVIEEARGETVKLREDVARGEETLRMERQASAEKLAAIEQAGQALRESFQALASEALQSNNRAFLDLAAASLGEFQQKAKSELEGKHKAVEDIVRPISETLGKVEAKLGEVEKERQAAYATLAEQVRAMTSDQKQLQSETANLVKALRAPTVRGRWGEIQLKRVVEMAGMLDHCDFIEQETLSSEDGRLRPDLIVKLPGGKHIVVDSKAPLSAYLEAHESASDAERELRLREHAQRVRAHISELASKRYWSQLPATPEMVVMFLPGESFFSAALQFDPSLIEFGVAQKVIPASPTTLISLLRAVHYGWRQEKLAEDAHEISELGRELYERIAIWLEHLGRIGKGLTGAVSTYNSSIGSLETRVLVSARRFRELVGPDARELPEVESVDVAVRQLQAEEAPPALEPPALEPPAFSESARDR